MTSKWILAGVVLLAAILVVVVNFVVDKPRQTGELIVAATIFPLADIVQNIVGEEIKVVQIIPSGASPHSYALTPQQVAQVEGAKIIFAIGHGLDDPIIDSVNGVSEAQVIIVDEGIGLREFEDEHEDEHHAHGESNVDPHYWLAVPNAEIIAATVARKMSQLDPEQKDIYQQNLENYTVQLDDLENKLQEMARGIGQRNFVAMHDSWSYFAKQYGLTLVATYEPVEGRQPSVSELKDLDELIKREKIAVFYTEPQKAATSAVRFLKDEFGLQIRTLDPIGGFGEKNSYVELMLGNMRTLTRDL
ncbi:MAG: metal ABC transporter substrate-binding protein [bacterium]